MSRFDPDATKTEDSSRAWLKRWQGRAVLVATTTISCVCFAPAGQTEEHEVFGKENLVAWCIVPFDASRRGPQTRADMLQELGISKVAYDWRTEHVPTFEEEIFAYKACGLEFFAFWDWHPNMAALVKKHDIRPQFWKMLSDPEGDSQEEKVVAAAGQVMPLVEITRELECKLGLYNHGGWAGEPKNLVAVCEYLRENADANHVGIVYNLHHGHGHIADFADVLKRMQPYLLCLNLNGMNEGARPKIVPLGQGQHDKTLLTIIQKSGYDGPIGIIDHRNELDAKQSLQQNLDGLARLREHLPADP